MVGTRAFRQALIAIKTNLSVLYQRNDISPENIDWLIMHQASGRALKMVEKFGYPPEKTINIVEKVGNTIAASIPLVLAKGNREGMFRRGDMMLVGGTGAGLSVAFSIIRW